MDFTFSLLLFDNLPSKSAPSLASTFKSSWCFFATLILLSKFAISISGTSSFNAFLITASSALVMVVATSTSAKAEFNSPFLNFVFTSLNDFFPLIKISSPT
ncbi:hypothetical protein MrNuV_ORF006 [Macrobrachium rosenbergii nudivirus]|nr:hypothetical protein MrNuV_ORF006 [Macrobrachium rosenbergii nudivirus]